jgi:hypothetical protein
LFIAGVMGYWYAWIVLGLVLVVGIAYRSRTRSSHEFGVREAMRHG